MRTFRESNEGIFKCSSCADKIRLSLTLIALLFSRHKRATLGAKENGNERLYNRSYLRRMHARASVPALDREDREGSQEKRNYISGTDGIKHENFKRVALPDFGSSMNDSSIDVRTARSRLSEAPFV